MTQGTSTAGERTRVAPHALDQGFEPTDVPVRSIALAAGGLVVAVVGVALALWAMNVAFTARIPPPGPIADQRQDSPPPPPRLQVDPAADLARVRARNEARLTGWDWIDQGAGIVRMPIDQAMAVIASRGWPSRAGATGPGTGGSASMGQIIRDTRNGGRELPGPRATPPGDRQENGR